MPSGRPLQRWDSSSPSVNYFAVCYEDDCRCVASVRIFLKKVCPSTNPSLSLLHGYLPSLPSTITPSAVQAPPIWAVVSTPCWQWRTIPHGQTAFSVLMESSANLGQLVVDMSLLKERTCVIVQGNPSDPSGGRDYHYLCGSDEHVY